MFLICSSIYTIYSVEVVNKYTQGNLTDILDSSISSFFEKFKNFGYISPAVLQLFLYWMLLCFFCNTHKDIKNESKNVLLAHIFHGLP